MTGKTTIEWTHQPGYVGASWNPTVGCTRVSAGCDNCYAFALHDRRFASNLKAAKDAHVHRLNKIAQLTDPVTIIERARVLDVTLPFSRQYDLPFSRVQLLPERLDVPLRTRTPTCYFVDSMADLFHEDVPDEFIQRVWIAMFNAPQHRFLILTKRPERARAFLTDPNKATLVKDLDREERMREWHGKWASPEPLMPLPNVWLGTSVEDQRAADERIPHLVATPAAVRFLSCEPLLGPVRLYGPASIDTRPRVDWVIVGGESGPRARPMDLAWARSLVAQCRAAGVAVFVKQLGSKPVSNDGCAMDRLDNVDGDRRYSVKLRESHGRDMDEWPEDLRIREFPR